MKEYFKGMEYEQKDGETLAGKSALGLTFQGEVDTIVMIGECYFLSNQGYGYWLMAWTPAADQEQVVKVAQEWEAVRKGFGLGKDREGWGEKVARLLPLRGTKASY